MAVVARETTAKVRIAYEKGSQTLNQCKLTAADSDLFAVASAIVGLRKDDEAVISKIMEADLLSQ